MRVVVTGGTGVIGRATVSALLERGHEVGLLTRNAGRDCRRWPSVKPLEGSIDDPASLHGLLDGWDVVLHIAGIFREAPPQRTFETLNVEGTEHVVREAERAGVRRFIYVSSLGAERGESAYHRSKLRGEEITRTFDGEWVICRPGNVYGPGDEVISLLLRLVRTIPAIPVVGMGAQEFQPVWHEDLAAALAAAVDMDGLSRRVLDLAGGDRTTPSDLIARLSALTGKDPVVLPVPEFLASIGVRAASAITTASPFTEDQLTMLREGNVIEAGRENALITVFGVTPTPLDEGLRRLVDEQPEVLPREGIGKLQRKRFYADITGSGLTAEALFDLIQQRFPTLVPLNSDAEPGTDCRLEEGATITLDLSPRGNIQVRVDECTERAATMVTLAGHPLAGIVRLECRDLTERVRFEVVVYDRPASTIDFLLMHTIGGWMQDGMWEELVTRVVNLSGGEAPGGVEVQKETLDDDEAGGIERWAEELVMRHRREAESAP